MNQWTKDAEELWQQFSNDMRSQLDQSDVDPDEVLEDMRRHVETELQNQNLPAVTKDDLKKVLNRLDIPANTLIPDIAPIQPEMLPTKPVSTYNNLVSFGGSFYIIALGVLLPIAAASFELVTRICSQIFFDPMPSIWHILLFYLVPVSNFACFLAVKMNLNKQIKFFGFLNGIAIGSSLFYTIWFLPILPFSAMGLIAMGIGACGLAPLLSFIACLIICKRLKLLLPEQKEPKTPFLWSGFTTGFAVLLLLILPNVLTIIGLNMTASPDTATQTRGVRLLRACSSKRLLLKLCYNTGGPNFWGIDISGTQDLSTEEIRGIYYRVTGKSFNTERPNLYVFRGSDDWMDNWDFDQAGDVVGGHLKNLALVSSQMDANLQADGAVGYLEWIMTFQNDHQWQDREARCQIQLPPGGVVSRLTLWIDGKECEAAFGGRNQTKGAYKSVVQRQRDPVLVTTKGPDQVLVQCFPVPENGGKMKIRLGITYPLDLLSKEQALLQLPYINERNFQIPESTEHQLWVEADGTLSAKLELKTETHKDKHAIRGVITNKQLEHQLASIHLQRNSETTSVWAKREFDNEQVAVLQTLHNNKGKALIDKAVIVVDTSRAMKAYIENIASVLEELYSDSDFYFEIISADDIPKVTYAFELKRENFKGGKDNIPALIQAWDSASEVDNGAVVWIHGPQPHIFGAVDPLLQRWMRRPDGPRLIHLQTAPGSNKIIEDLDGIDQVSVVARSSDIKEDLKRVFGQLKGSLPKYKITREQVPVDTIKDPVKRASSHIVRLWAKEQVDKLRAKRGDKNETQAKVIAVKHQLVTPVSGAVVLENREQYERNNLQPVDPETVPTIPEPASVLLFGIGALFLHRRRNRKIRK